MVKAPRYFFLLNKRYWNDRIRPFLYCDEPTKNPFLPFFPTKENRTSPRRWRRRPTTLHSFRFPPLIWFPSGWASPRSSSVVFLKWPENTNHLSSSSTRSIRLPRQGATLSQNLPEESRPSFSSRSDLFLRSKFVWMRAGCIL